MLFRSTLQKRALKHGENVFLKGTIVNVAAVTAGSIMGHCLGHVIPERMRRTIMAGPGLAVALIGLKLAIRRIR